MVKPMLHIKLEDNPELDKLLEEMRVDGAPRVLERDGEAVAIVLDPEDYAEWKRVPRSRVNKEKIMSFAGIWSDLDADEMIADIYRWRDEAPPSPDPAACFEDNEVEENINKRSCT